MTPGSLPLAKAKLGLFAMQQLMMLFIILPMQHDTKLQGRAKEICHASTLMYMCMFTGQSPGLAKDRIQFVSQPGFGYRYIAGPVLRFMMLIGS